MATVQGFESQMQQGTVVLFSGEHPGAGKRTAAEALGSFSSPSAGSSWAPTTRIASHDTTRALLASFNEGIDDSFSREWPSH
jgi:ABC-type branched-subunit amino acid transport system ATPase component